MLVNWAPMSLARRCHEIWEIYNIRVSVTTLKKVYKKAGITWTRPKYEYAHKTPDEHLLFERQQFCVELVRLIEQQANIWYFDVRNMTGDNPLGNLIYYVGRAS